MTLLNTIFDWILSASLRASVLVPVVLAAQWLLRNHLPATWRYALWLPVLAALLVPALPILPPSFTQRFSAPVTRVAVEERRSPLPSEEGGALNSPEVLRSGEEIAPMKTPLPAAETSSESAVPPAGPTGGSDRSPSVASSAPVKPIDWGAVALWAWLAGAAGIGASVLASFVATMRRVKHTALPVHPGLLARVARLAPAAGLRRAPRVRRSPAVSSPAVCGLWRPVLLINERFEQDLSEDEMELILRHELAHIRRGDLLLNALQCVLLALHWFNPLLWLAFFRARADREAACDQAVLRGEPALRRAAYGHTLLKMETRCAPAGLCLGFVGILQGRGTLRARIQSIIARRKLNAVTAATVATGIAVFALVGITGVGAAPGTEGPRTYPPSMAALLPDYLGPNAGSLLYTNPEESKGPRWEYQAGLKTTDPVDKVLLKSTDLHGGKRIVGRVDGSVLPVEEEPEGGVPTEAEEDAAASGGEIIRWPSGRAFTVPANQSLEIFRNEYKASATKGMINSPNLSLFDHEDASFGCGIDYKVMMHYKGTKAGKDYYLLTITYPENGKTRTVSRQLVYEGKEVEVFRDAEFRIVVRPQTVNFADDLPKDSAESSTTGLPAGRGARLPDLAKAFPGEQLFNQTKLEGTESYGFATDLPFEELEKRLTAFLGNGWKKTEVDPSVAKDVTRQYPELLGSASFTNPAFPGVHVFFTQIEQEVDGRKSVASIMIGGIGKDDQR